MPSVIAEILAVSGTNRPHFVPNNAVNNVLVTTPDPMILFSSLGGTATFVRKDSVLILGAGFRLPYCFGMADNQSYIGLWWIDPTSLPLGTTKTLIMTAYNVLPNEEISFNGSGTSGFFAKFPDTGFASGAYLGMSSTFYDNVSQINAPTILNGDTQYITPFVRVQHLLPLGPP